MRKNLLRWEIAGALFVCAAGTLLQFLYRWSGDNAVVAAFSGVNESTWEHMKTFFVPYFVFTMVQFIIFAEPFRNFFACKGASAAVGLVLIPALFYTISGALGETPDWVNIAIFYVAAVLMFFLSFCLLTRGALRSGWAQIVGFALLWLLLFAFVYFTYRTPQLPIFRDPVTHCYGLERSC